MLKRIPQRLFLAASSAVILGLASGCDSGGVADIVFGSLRLAFGIVDAAT